jgi:hypothetical protein
MAADDDVLHAEHVHRVLQHRQAAEVVVHHQVRDIAVHEQFTRRQAHDLVRRHPAVGASDPQVARLLLRHEFAEEPGPGGDHARGPGAVLREEFGELVHQVS